MALSRARAARHRVAERTRDLPPRLDLQPGEDLLGVIAGGESADAEPLGDLRIRAPLGNQQRDLRLSQGQSAGAHDLLRSEQRSVRELGPARPALAGTDAAARSRTTRRPIASTRAISSTVRNGFVT